MGVCFLSAVWYFHTLTLYSDSYGQHNTDKNKLLAEGHQ